MNTQSWLGIGAIGLGMIGAIVLSASTVGEQSVIVPDETLGAERSPSASSNRIK